MIQGVNQIKQGTQSKEVQERKPAHHAGLPRMSRREHDPQRIGRSGGFGLGDTFKVHGDHDDASGDEFLLNRLIVLHRFTVLE